MLFNSYLEPEPALKNFNMKITCEATAKSVSPLVLVFYMHLGKCESNLKCPFAIRIMIELAVMLYLNVYIFLHGTIRRVE